MDKPRFLLLLLVVMIAIGTNPISAQNAPGTIYAEEMLPANTLLYLGMGDGSKYLTEMKKTKIWQIVESPEWKEFFESIDPDFLKEIEKNIQQAQSFIGMEWHAIPNAFSGQFVIAVTDIIPPGEQPFPVPVITLFWDLGTEKEKVEALLKKLLHELYKQQEGKFSETSYEIYGHKVTCITTPGMPIYYAYSGKTLVVSSGKDWIEGILSGKKPEKNLADSPRYKSVKEKLLQGNPGKMAYLNLQDLKLQASRLIGPKADDIEGLLKETGLDSLEAIGLGVSFRNGRVVESFYLHTPAGRTKDFASLFPVVESERNLTKKLPNWIIAFSNGRMDLTSFYGTIMKVFQQVSPRDYRDFERDLKSAEKDLGISLEQDIFAALGTEYLFAIGCNAGLIPDVAFQWSLKDAGKLRQAFQKILAQAPQKSWREVKWKGHSFTYFNLSNRYKKIPFAPTFVILDDKVIMTLYPESAKNILTEWNRATLPVECEENLAGRKYTYMEYFNIAFLVGPIYRTALPLIQSLIPKEEMPFEPALLPSSKLIERYFSNFVFAAFNTQEGVLWETHSPAGFLPLQIFAGSASWLVARKQPSRRFIEKERLLPQEAPQRAFPKDKDDDDDWGDDEEKKPDQNAQAEEKPVEASSKISGKLLALTESRVWKVDDPEFRNKLWINNPTMVAKIYASVPSGSIAFGPFAYEVARDEKGNDLKLPYFDKTFRRFYSYQAKDIQSGKGHIFDLNLKSPSRDSKTFTLKGSIPIMVGDGREEIKVAFKTLVGNRNYAVKQIPNVLLTFATVSPTSIAIKLKGNQFHLDTIVVSNNGAEKNASSQSGYKTALNEHTETFYWYGYRIPEDATIVIRYYKQIQEKKLEVDLQDFKLP